VDALCLLTEMVREMANGKDGFGLGGLQGDVNNVLLDGNNLSLLE